MEFMHSLKTRAQQIIELSEQLGPRVHTWDQDQSAPATGYTDRAGFIAYDNIELYADVYAPDDGSASKLRARLAWTPEEDTQELFTIITLDFTVEGLGAKELVDKAKDLTRQGLIALLNNNKTTKPDYIHVSLESGKGPTGLSQGIRFEHKADDIDALTDENKAEFIQAVDSAYTLIRTKI